MYCQFNIQQFYLLPTQWIFVFCVDLSTNSDYSPIRVHINWLVFTTEAECVYCAVHLMLILLCNGYEPPRCEGADNPDGPNERPSYFGLDWPCVLHTTSTNRATYLRFVSNSWWWEKNKNVLAVSITIRTRHRYVNTSLFDIEITSWQFALTTVHIGNFTKQHTISDAFFLPACRYVLTVRSHVSIVKLWRLRFTQTTPLHSPVQKLHVRYYNLISLHKIWLS
jgi:hypothetical protein